MVHRLTTTIRPAVFAAGTRGAESRPLLSGKRTAGQSHRLAAEPGLRAAGGRLVPVLCADGDAGLPPDCAVRRSQFRAGARRHPADGAAGVSLFEPAALGLDL